MTRKEIIVVIMIIILILTIVLIFHNKNQIKKTSKKITSQNSVVVDYNDEDGKYIVYDETGKEIYNGTNKAEAEFRERHPDFNPGFEELDQNMIPTEVIED